MVNRSETVGRPLAALLANDGACVYSVDITGVQQFSRGQGIKKQRHEVTEKEGWSLEDCIPLSDVVISGVPGEKFKLPTRFLKDGAVCINFSTEKVEHTRQLWRVLRLTACVVEFRVRCQGQGKYLRSCDRESHDCDTSEKLAGTRSAHNRA